MILGNKTDAGYVGGAIQRSSSLVEDVYEDE